jgi:D-alanyl-D-alanine carboxypeptidase/D-alanyl-D-alanine-endopeptidase (penicillin-binding protein 4)
VTEGRTRIRVSARTVGKKVRLTISGQIRADAGRWSQRRRVDDPLAVAGEAVRRALLDAGIALGQARSDADQAPVGATVLATHQSAPLSDLVRWMNKVSSNPIAEAVVRAVGAHARAAAGPASWQDSQTAVQAYLRACGVEGARVDNGSGLFDATSVSAQQLARVLWCARRDFRVAADLVASLPAAGVDGTLARRLSGGVAVGRVRAKTGTLSAVSTLSGYAGIGTDRQLVFAFLFNQLTPPQRALARRAQDRAATAMVRYLKPSPAPP